MLQTILLVAMIIISVALSGVILLQKSEGGALGMGGGGGGGGGFMTARGAANLLTRTTSILAVLFFLCAIGLTIAGVSAMGLALDLPILAAAGLVTTLSLGYDLTQPLLAGIATDLGPNRGQAMGLNVFALFTGFGLGSLLFSRVLRLGLNEALLIFGVVALAAAVAGMPLFRGERGHAAATKVFHD